MVLPIYLWAKSRQFVGMAITILLVSVAQSADIVQQPVSFVNDVVPVLTKASCNTGGCHAKAGGGQNGFQLSLLGFEVAEDYEAIVREGRGRRLFPPLPEESLLLRKAAGETPHGGGVRLSKDSEGYEIIRRWISEGAAFQTANDLKLETLEVIPNRNVVKMGAQQQLQALATFSDGSKRDVTEFALFESNSEAMAEVSSDGLVKIQQIPGRVAIMLRYQDKSAVFTAAIPLGAPIGELPPPNNFIDELVFGNLQEIGIPPSPVSDDATFLRRVTLDITGRLPTAKETEVFLSSTDADKRDQVIERLLRSPGYADFFANKWTSLLKNRRDDASDITSNFAFHAWIRDSLLDNVPYDQLVRELLAATGTVVANPPVAWYKRVKEPKEQLEDVAQLFLGVRLQCAQCHHHPFERWSQDDYYSLAAFFSQVGRKPTETRGEDMIFHKRGIATATNMKTGEKLRPAALGDSVGDITPEQDPRLLLADWISKPNNPFFAKAVVNRYWKHFFKRGLIEPEDDIRDTNPPSNPELLTALEEHFINSGYDLKELVRAITRSKAYQLSSAPNEFNLIDEQNYSRYYPRRLQAEVLLDAVNDLTASPTDFPNLPLGTRAVALPDNSYNKASPFLRVFGRPDNSSVCECERVQSSSLAQSLHLINSSEIKSKLGAAKGRATNLAGQETAVEEKIGEIYRVAFSREPTAEELQVAIEYVQQIPTDADGKPIDANQAARQNYQDLIWALMNSKEFLFNH
ncbi:S-layer protein [Blastopirellula marina]|uniref:S-layer protein n=1 Tax=Blastopirellula marina TaxID=124 RepID=A0A2S8F582_9BACT|nr:MULTISPECIES: DUF1549 domain-containing protein [Pirellulaceae]PQO27307.1 S-layer protein [Blastopirellula marina]RCS47844.1 DUF1549 domain-containing protein [Bremerella cremea]